MSTLRKPSIMQSLTHILIMPMWFGCRISVLSIVSILEKKALRTISFQSRDFHLSPLFKKQNLYKFEDKIQLENVLLLSKHFNNILPTIFDKWFTTLCSKIHNCNTAASFTLQVNYLSPHSELIYMEKCAVNACCKIQTAFGNVIWKNLTASQIKTLLTKKCNEEYWQIFHLILMGRLC